MHRLLVPVGTTSLRPAQVLSAQYQQMRLLFEHAALQEELPLTIMLFLCVRVLDGLHWSMIPRGYGDP